MKSRKNFSSSDVISDLPGHVIDNILARLPLGDAVRTSILSREWRHRWTYIPDLVFDFRFDKSFLRNHKLETIIYQVLLHHKGPINKFSLQVPTYGSNPDVDNWILVLSNYEVRDFTFHFSGGYRHQMTSHFFAFQHLRHLNLYRCIFKPPPECRVFSKLVTLDLRSVDFEPSMFELFISQCLLLERVRLVDCTDWVSFEVEGPSLRFFTLHGVFKCIRFKNCPVLAEVSLSTPVLPRLETNNCIMLVGFLPTLEKLHLHPRLLEVLAVGDVQNRLPRSLTSLRVLNLSMFLDTIEEVVCALCFVRNSPNLQILKITLYASKVVEAVVEFIRAQETPDHYLKHIRRMEIPNFTGTEPQMEFVRYLLASTLGLEEMVIIPATSSLGLNLMNQLKQIPKASSSVQISVF